MIRRLAAAIVLVSLTAASPAPTVTVEGGAILGATGPDGIARYLGVPFAASPVAGLRWRAPQPVVPWQGTLETTHFAPACPQPLPPPGSFYQHEFFATSERQSEDCLYLNVYSPAKTASERLPVMVWLYGGGFVQGSGSLPSFDGTALAQHGVVLVTINYRLGPLGFLATPELDAESPDHASGNYGIMDQIAALRWVKGSVAAFGGDPDNVTVFGQSAGALSVGAVMASPQAQGLFRRAIVESDPMFGMADPMPTHEQAEAGAAKFFAALGVHSLAEARLVSSTDLVRAMGSNAVAYGLRISVDGAVLPRDEPELIAQTGGNAETVLLGTNLDEGTELLPPATPAALDALIRRRFGAQAEALAVLYPGHDDKSATIAQDRLQSDYLFVTAAREAEVLAAHGKGAYLYRFTRAAPGSDPLAVGAFHSAELAYVFGTQDTIDRPWTQRDRDLAQQMQAYWTDFARTGDPNGEGLLRWPLVQGRATQAMGLGDQTSLVPILDPAHRALFDAYLDRRLPR